MKVLIDTNAYVAFKRGDAEALEILRRAPSIGINAIVLGELLGGFALGRKKDANRGELATFLALRQVVFLPLTKATAEQYAGIYLGRRRAGTPIPTNDMWIAASALEHGFSVFSYDSHFKQIDGLRSGATAEDFNDQ